MRLDDQEIELILQAQEHMKNSSTVPGLTCPFKDIVYKKISMILLCDLCHRWMKTDPKESSHPCFQIDDWEEIERRFHEDPKERR